MDKRNRRLFNLIAPYIDRMVYNGGHYKAYPKGDGRPIVISATSSDVHRDSQVLSDFRRRGIKISENKNGR